MLVDGANDAADAVAVVCCDFDPHVQPAIATAHASVDVNVVDHFTSETRRFIARAP